MITFLEILASDLPGSAQLGIAAPFVIALGLVGRWLMAKLDASEKAKDILYEKIVEQVVPALNANAGASKDLIYVAEELRNDLKQLYEKLEEERIEKVRLEAQTRSPSG